MIESLSALVKYLTSIVVIQRFKGDIKFAIKQSGLHLFFITQSQSATESLHGEEITEDFTEPLFRNCSQICQFKKLLPSISFVWLEVSKL